MPISPRSLSRRSRPGHVDFGVREYSAWPECDSDRNWAVKHDAEAYSYTAFARSHLVACSSVTLGTRSDTAMLGTAHPPNHEGHDDVRNPCPYDVDYPLWNVV